MPTMQTAPKDGRVIVVRGPKGWRRAYYYDCAWLRQGPFADPTITDCWRVDGKAFEEIELDEAQEWRPIPKRK